MNEWMNLWMEGCMDAWMDGSSTSFVELRAHPLPCLLFPFGDDQYYAFRMLPSHFFSRSQVSWPFIKESASWFVFVCFALCSLLCSYYTTPEENDLAIVVELMVTIDRNDQLTTTTTTTTTTTNTIQQLIFVNIHIPHDQNRLLQYAGIGNGN